VDPGDGAGDRTTADPDRSEPGRFHRGVLEFDRVSFFTDAVFAIAMTLLIVTIEPPSLTGGDTAGATTSG
jgi:hypothetical protein